MGASNSKEAELEAEAAAAPPAGRLLLLLFDGVVFSLFGDVDVDRLAATAPPVDLRVGVLRRLVALLPPAAAVDAFFVGVPAEKDGCAGDNDEDVLDVDGGDFVGFLRASDHAFARALASALASFLDFLGVGLLARTSSPSSPPTASALRFLGGIVYDFDDVVGACRWL